MNGHARRLAGHQGKHERRGPKKPDHTKIDSVPASHYPYGPGNEFVIGSSARASLSIKRQQGRPVAILIANNLHLQIKQNTISYSLNRCAFPANGHIRLFASTCGCCQPTGWRGVWRYGVRQPEKRLKLLDLREFI